PTPAGSAFPAQQPPPHTGTWHQPQAAYYSGSQPLPGRRTRVGTVVFSLIAVALVVTMTVLLVRYLSTPTGTTAADGGPGSSTDTPRSTGAPEQPPTKRASGEQPPTSAPPEQTTTAKAVPVPEELITPAGARKAVAALTEVMGGTKVSDLVLYQKFAIATAPTAAVKNGFDDFEYRNGVAKRTGPDGVDADQTVLDLTKVNWDALTALWERANKELNVPKPTMRYVILDTDLIDGTPSMRLYLTDDYGAAYLAATLDGKVTKVYAREG
ncbi:MAG TPA: serine/threonine protein kinase, partial [Actinokineospora sp.]|nr:serine/threonine protein kinase [Actinokineospora sp.]